MSGLNYLKFGNTLSNICNTTQLDDATKCHYAFKNFWGEPCTWSEITESMNKCPATLHIDLCTSKKSVNH